jgi:hypothetical protein
MVLAVWSDGADGARGGESQAQHAKWVTTDHTVADGDQIRVWVDDAGTPVDAPTPPSMAASEAVAIAAGTWGAAIVGLIAIVAVLRSPLNRIRVTQLDREIKRFASGGTPNLSQ